LFRDRDGDGGGARERLAALHDGAKDKGTDDPLPAVRRPGPSTPAEILARLAARAPSGGTVGATSSSGVRGRVGRLVRRWVPAGLRDARLDPGRPGALVLSIVALVAALTAAVGVWVDRPVAEPAPPLLAVASGRSSGQPSPEQHPTQIVISVVGRVANPGLVTLPEGARVADAVQAAGGALPETDLTTLNLARKVVDGEQVALGVPAPPEQPTDTGDASRSSRAGSRGRPNGKVNINTATAEELRGLPGVGPVTAQRILEWRARHGRFTAITQLREVGGIGESRFARLKDMAAL
jgi:competence protein ComEA